MNSDFVKKYKILAGLFNLYHGQGLRCFAVKDGIVDQRIWDLTHGDQQQDLMVYFSMDNYDFGFVRKDNVKMVIELVVEHGEIKYFEIYELVEGGANELA